MESLINLTSVCKNYLIGDITIKALNNINIDINSGEFIVVLGPSGCGKTTLLNLIGGIDDVSKGSIHVNGQTITNMTEKEFTKYRKNDVGFIFQFYNLIPTLTAIENVELAARLLFSAKEAYRRSKKILEQVGFSHMEMQKYPNQLSGGQQQRIAIARALVKMPKIILADEPTGNLDTTTSDTILKLMKQLAKEHNMTFLIVTHNISIGDLADRIINLRDGEIEAINEGGK